LEITSAENAGKVWKRSSTVFAILNLGK